MKIVYIFPQCIYNKYYACDFRKSLLFLRIIVTSFIIYTFKNVGSFIEPESNANLQPKRRKVTEKETLLQKV